jgi:hypothetical protein
MKENPKKRERLTMEQLTANAEKLLKGKELNPSGKKLFEKVIKKAATPKKQHGSK